MASALLELNVADKCKGCPRGPRALNRNSVLYALQPPGRHLANRHHLNTGRPIDCCGLRFVQWRHASPNVDARKDPKNNPMVRVYQHLEDELTRAGAGNEGILALTTTREGAQNLRNYFDIARKKANAETAVKVAGATAKHCIVIHGSLPFLAEKGAI